MADDQQHASGLLQLGRDAGTADLYRILRLHAAQCGNRAGRHRCVEILDCRLSLCCFPRPGSDPDRPQPDAALPVNTEIYGGKVDADNLLFQSEAPPVASFGDRLLVTRKITVAGRPWTILFRPTSAFSQPSSRAIR
jgi:CHASE1-domain containing sensor protein